MTPTVGFILITHGKPDQIIRLLTRLNHIFDNPPIVCHHDFSKCALPLSSVPGNVSFVQPHLETGWAQFSIVEATVRALRKMYEAPNNPDWFILLSGADYPIKQSAQVLHDLKAGSYDAHIRFELIKANAFEREWQKTCFLRYCTKGIPLPSLTGRPRPRRRRLLIWHPLLTRFFLPFSKNLRCHAGSQWFSANRRAAEYIISFHDTKPQLATHYKKVMFSDESYFQTIIANSQGLKLNNNNWRYTDWSPGGPHPKTLLVEDMPALVASTAHFARKFDADTDVRILDELDAFVG